MFRSQVSAPIELVVAIIILVTSITLALFVLNDVGRTQCSAQLKSEVQKLQLAMQDLALQSPPSTRQMFFTMPSCKDFSVDAVRFVYFNDPKYCRECPGQLGGCWKIDLATYKPTSDGEIGSYAQQSQSLSSASVCVDIAGDLELIDENLNGANPECVSLSPNPCPATTPDGQPISPGECSALVSGVPSTIYREGANSPAHYLTLGKSSRADRVFKVELKKGLYTGSQGETGAIYVCAKTCTGGQC